VKDDNPEFFGGFFNICFGYGLGVMIGILISGGVRQEDAKRTFFYKFKYCTIFHLSLCNLQAVKCTFSDI
jgi:hypothetical protein